MNTVWILFPETAPPPFSTLRLTRSHLGDSGRKKRTMRKGIPDDAMKISKVIMLGMRYTSRARLT